MRQPIVTTEEQPNPPPVPASTPATHSKRLGIKPWQLAAAAQLHGWAEHAHHAGAPIELSAADFQAAIEAACADVIKPHEPAVSPHQGKGL